VDILRAAYETTPEPATVALFEQVRRDPGSVCSARRDNGGATSA
jgi:hypothetical protein